MGMGIYTTTNIGSKKGWLFIMQGHTHLWNKCTNRLFIPDLINVFLRRELHRSNFWSTKSILEEFYEILWFRKTQIEILELEKFESTNAILTFEIGMLKNQEMCCQINQSTTVTYVGLLKSENLKPCNCYICLICVSYSIILCNSNYCKFVLLNFNNLWWSLKYIWKLSLKNYFFIILPIRAPPCGW